MNKNSNSSNMRRKRRRREQKSTQWKSIYWYRHKLVFRFLSCCFPCVYAQMNVSVRLYFQFCWFFATKYCSLDIIYIFFNSLVNYLVYFKNGFCFQSIIRWNGSGNTFLSISFFYFCFETVWILVPIWRLCFIVKCCIVIFLLLALYCACYWRLLSTITSIALCFQLSTAFYKL